MSNLNVLTSNETGSNSMIDINANFVALNADKLESTYCGTAGGTADVMTLTPTPAIASYAAAVGKSFLFIAVGTNTGSAPTVNISGKGALATTMGSVAVPVGGIISGNFYWALLETASSVRIAPYDATSVNGDTLNGPLYGPNFVEGFRTQATATGTTTLVFGDAYTQVFTGSAIQTCKLPTTSVVAGQQYTITNQSTGLVTVQSSGANTITTLGLNQSAVFTALVATPTTAANWTSNKTNLNANANGKRILVVTQSATPAMDTDNGDIMQITGIAQAITSMTTSLTGTPAEGDMIEIQFTDNATARAITWGASFVATTVALPTTTVLSVMLRVLFQRTGSSWACMAVV